MQKPPRDSGPPIIPVVSLPSVGRKSGIGEKYEFGNKVNPFVNLLTGRVEQFSLRPLRPGQKGYLRTGLETSKPKKVNAGVLASSRNIFTEKGRSKTSKGSNTPSSPKVKLELPDHFSSMRNPFDESSKTIWSSRRKR